MSRTAAKTGPDRSSDGPPTALIVEAREEVSRKIERWLEEAGFRCLIQRSGRDVSESVPTVQPDVVLINRKLPDLNGFAVCRALKWNRATNLVPVIMILADEDSPDEHDWSIRVGANAYLTSPLDREAMLEAVREVREWRNQHTEEGTSGEVVFDIRSHQSYLHQLNDLLTNLYAHTPLTERQVKDLNQAVLEMGSNAIEWGHKKQIDLVLNVIYRIHDDRVALIVRDQGEGFDPNGVEHAANDEDPLAHVEVRTQLGLREGGFGIMLSRGLVDHFAYNEKGNEVTLVKYFDSGASQAQQDTAATS